MDLVYGGNLLFGVASCPMPMRPCRLHAPKLRCRIIDPKLSLTEIVVIVYYASEVPLLRK